MLVEQFSLLASNVDNSQDFDIYIGDPVVDHIVKDCRTPHAGFDLVAALPRLWQTRNLFEAGVQSVDYLVGFDEVVLGDICPDLQ